VIRWDDKLERMREMSSVSEQKASLVQSFPDQRNIALLEIPDASVDQFGRPARRPFREIRLLH
jgi:hypothetical protein